MKTEPTPEQQTAQLMTDVALLTQKLALLKAQTELESARQTNGALAANNLIQALKAQAVSQYQLDEAQAKLPFADLQGIKAGIAGLSLPEGMDGTVKVSAGTAGTALLRSKRPMLETLAEVADDLCTICPNGAALLTEAQLAAGCAAQFTLDRIGDETAKLAVAAKLAHRSGAMPRPALAPFVAGAYALGLTIDTINSLAKLLRTNRQLDVFDADTEAVQMLGYLLESKKKGFVANPGMLGDGAITEAGALLKKLSDLGDQVQVANEALAADQIPTDTQKGVLKAEIDRATSLLDGLDPTKNPDAFWAQATGQVLAKNIRVKERLFIEAKAQTVQVTESRWFRSERILARGEVQVAYRVFNADGSLKESGVILKASGADKTQIDRLGPYKWPV